MQSGVIKLMLTPFGVGFLLVYDCMVFGDTLESIDEDIRFTPFLCPCVNGIKDKADMYDKIIIGAGLYGLYSALFCAQRGNSILVLEYDDAPFKRATFINQARVHMGYHHLRSYSTAVKSAGYFNHFNEDYGFCILRKFDQVYATSSEFSWSDATQFKKFCKAVNIRCDEVSPSKYFNDGYCDGAFLTEEYTYDAHILKEFFLEKLKDYPNVQIMYASRLRLIEND